MPTQPITLDGVAGFKVKLKNTTKYLGLNQSNEFFWTTDANEAHWFDGDWCWNGSSPGHMVYDGSKVKKGTSADSNWQARANVSGKEFQLPYGSPTQYLGQDVAGNVALQASVTTLVEE